MQLIDDLVTENAELQQQLQSSEREKETYTQQLMRKEAELTRAEETIRREQQQMRQLVRVHEMGVSPFPTLLPLTCMRRLLDLSVSSYTLAYLWFWVVRI